MKLNSAVNLRTIANAQSGVQRFAVEISRKLNFARVSVSPRYSSGVLGHLWEQLLLPFIVGRFDVLFSPGNTGPILVRNQILVIHDLATLRFPDSFSYLFRIWYQVLLPILVKRTLCVVTVSKFSRLEIAGRFRLSPHSIRVVPNAVSLLRSSTDSIDAISALERFGVKANKYVLIVGSLDPRKNLERALGAWSSVSSPGVKLLVVGGGLDRVFSNKCGLERSMKDVIYGGRVSDDDLYVLYTHAMVLWFPSIYEGFGLPPIEAMSVGCPCLVSNCSSIPEVCGPDFVCGGAVNYFDPLDVDSMTVALNRFFGRSETELAEMKCRGISWVRRYSWDSSTGLVSMIAQEMALYWKGMAI